MYFLQAQKYFVDRPAIWVENDSLAYKKKGRDDSIAQYTGGLITVCKMIITRRDKRRSLKVIQIKMSESSLQSCT